MIADLLAKARKLTGILAVPAWRRALLRQRVAAGVEHAGVLRKLGRVRTVVDIGANRGQFALIARKCFPGARIDSFEPLAEPADRFERVFAGDENVHLHRLAVGEREGGATIHVSRRDDSSSLLPITERQSALFPGTDEREIRTIRVAPLDSVLSAAKMSKPAMLKLDVQGFELQALHGCESLLSCFSYVYCECSFVELYEGQALAHEVLDYLQGHGFRLSGVYNLTYDKRGMAVQADFLFSKVGA